MTFDQETLKKYLNYDPETGMFVWAHGGRDGLLAGSKKDTGYIHIGFHGKYYKAHRLAWLYIHGDFPIKHIDHIDGNRGNNAISNLREASPSENNQNQRKPRSSNPYLGVSWKKGDKKWVAQIKINKKQIHLGLFDDPKKAYEKYLTAKRELHKFSTI